MSPPPPHFCPGGVGTLECTGFEVLVALVAHGIPRPSTRRPAPAVASLINYHLPWWGLAAPIPLWRRHCLLSGPATSPTARPAAISPPQPACWRRPGRAPTEPHRCRAVDFSCRLRPRRRNRRRCTRHRCNHGCSPAWRCRNQPDQHTAQHIAAAAIDAPPTSPPPSAAVAISDATSYHRHHEHHPHSPPPSSHPPLPPSALPSQLPPVYLSVACCL